MNKKNSPVTICHKECNIKYTCLLLLLFAKNSKHNETNKRKYQDVGILICF